VNGKDYGPAGFSISPARTGELEFIMESTLVTRTAMIAGLESSALTLGDAVEPTGERLQYRLDNNASERMRKTAEVPSRTAAIATPDAIALSCFQ
jgi:hypothetical protein